MARLERSRTKIAGAVDGFASTVLNARLVAFNNRVINPVMITLGERGLLPPTYALLETLGRRTGLRRRVPVANGLDGETFWLIAGLGERASFVRNLRVDPRVRVKARPARLRDGVRARWRTGTAHPLPDDDPRARHRQLGQGRPGYRLDGVLLRAIDEGNMLTVRIDLDPEPSTWRSRGLAAQVRSRKLRRRARQPAVDD